MTGRGPRRDPAGAQASRGRAPAGPTAVPVLAPAGPEVPALLEAAQRVLAACGYAEDAHADRALRMAGAVDPSTLPLTALVGPALPGPLARRIAAHALQRLAVALRPALRSPPRRWVAPDGSTVPGFRAVRVDPGDLATLERAAALLTHPRRSREGTLGGAVESLRTGPGEPPDDRHPAALGCLLAVLVRDTDPAAAALHAVADGAAPDDAAPDRVVLDAASAQAHREVGRRVLARLARTR